MYCIEESRLLGLCTVESTLLRLLAPGNCVSLGHLITPLEHTRYCASAVHNCKSIRLHIKKVEFNARTGHFTTGKTSGCANVTSNSSRAEKVLQLVWNLLNYARFEYARKIRKKNSFFIMWLTGCYMYNYWRTEQIRACVSRYFPSAWTAN